MRVHIVDFLRLAGVLLEGLAEYVETKVEELDDQEVDEAFVNGNTGKVGEAGQLQLARDELA